MDRQKRYRYINSVIFNTPWKNKIKVGTRVDTSKFPITFDLARLKSDILKLDIDKLVKITSGVNNLISQVDSVDVNKLKTVPIDLKKTKSIKMKIKMQSIKMFLKNRNIMQTNKA